MENMIITNLQLCRVCAVEGSQCIPIFEPPGLELSLHSKIQNHLTIQIEMSDNLPHQICEPCICKLNICHELVETAKAADMKLRHMFRPIDSASKLAIGEDKPRQDEIMEGLTEEQVEQYQLAEETIAADKTLGDVQFAIAITDSIEVVKTVDIKSGMDTAEMFSFAGSLDPGKLKIIQDQQFTVYQKDVLQDIPTNGSFEVDTGTFETHDNTESYEQNQTDDQVIGNQNATEKPSESSLIDYEQQEKELLENGNGDVYACPHCGKICSSPLGLDVHVSTHLDISPFLCDLCGKKFKHVNSLRCHKRTHLDEAQKKRHLCSFCSKGFRSKFHLFEHMNTHSGIRPYKCTECGKEFHKRIQLRQHNTKHLPDEEKLVCSICGARFSRRSNLRAHIKCHSENRKFSCRICSEEFSTLRELLSHRRKHTDADIRQRHENSEYGHPCQICGKVLAKKDSLVVHMKQHSGENKCWCNVCGKMLSSKASLRYHVRALHCTERSWHCQYCNKGFMSQELKDIHERTHTGVKPYQCSVCNKAFHSSSNLNQHMLKHSDQRNFQCMFCPKRFQRKGTLDVHLRTHTGEKPFICDICGNRFTQKNDMLKHQKTHTNTSKNNPNIACDLCSETFESKDEFDKHKIISHNVQMPVVFDTTNSEVIEIITQDGQNILISGVPQTPELA